MRTKRTYMRIINIFNKYAGTTLKDREIAPPLDVKVFKAIGEIKPDGVYGAYPSLLPVKAPPALSPDGKRVSALSGSPRGLTQVIRKGLFPHPRLSRRYLIGHPHGGFKEGRRGNKVPCDTKDVRIGDGSVRPPSARSPSYKESASGSGISPAERSRGLPQVNLPGQAGPGSTMPINLNAIGIKLNLNRPPDPRDDAWPPSRVEEASRVITSYLRHGGEDKRYNIQGSDGYVRVAVFVQLPMMAKLNIDPCLIELVLKSPNPRIMMSDDGARIRAVVY